MELSSWNPFVRGSELPLTPTDQNAEIRLVRFIRASMRARASTTRVRERRGNLRGRSSVTAGGRPSSLQKNTAQRRWPLRGGKFSPRSAGWTTWQGSPVRRLLARLRSRT
jgi:hypothetical protein